MSKLLKRRVAALEARPDDYVVVDMGIASFFGDLNGRLEANRVGRPFSHFSNPLRPRRTDTDADAMMSQAIARKRKMQEQDGPGARVAERLEQMRQKADPDSAALTAELDKRRADNIREIEREAKGRDRRRMAMLRLFPAVVPT
jgi:hypothetical protein